VVESTTGPVLSSDFARFVSFLIVIGDNNTNFSTVALALKLILHNERTNCESIYPSEVFH